MIDSGDALFLLSNLLLSPPTFIKFLYSSEIARINIFFKSSGFVGHKRSELYTNTDFLANFGGLIGMFMGASLLSLIEIFYFCMLRLILILRKIPNAPEKKDEKIISVTPAGDNAK